MLKVLNLYAGIGGNRKLWEDVEVTAVEINPKIAKVYQGYFPDDKVIIADAHQYLLEHFKKFDFIWSSPPCQTNSKVKEAGIKRFNHNPTYHNLDLYQEILLLERYYTGLFTVENVEPFYNPLIPAKKIDRHLFWSNFRLGVFVPNDKKRNHMDSDGKYLAEFFGYEYAILPGNDTEKRQILRNCVHPETGLYILNCAKNIITKQNKKQLDIFDNQQEK